MVNASQHSGKPIDTPMLSQQMMHSLDSKMKFIAIQRLYGLFPSLIFRLSSSVTYFHVYSFYFFCFVNLNVAGCLTWYNINLPVIETGMYAK